MTQFPPEYVQAIALGLIVLVLILACAIAKSSVDDE
jgi:hypothetical protein